MSEEMDTLDAALDGDSEGEYEGDLGDGAKKKDEGNEAIYVKITS